MCTLRGCRGDRRATGGSSRSVQLGRVVVGAATACRGRVSGGCRSVTLLPGTRATVGLRVDSHRDPAVAFAASKAIAVVTRQVPGTPLKVIDMLAPLSIAPPRFTGSDTELVGGHEVGPFMDLLSETLTTVPNV